MYLNFSAYVQLEHEITVDLRTSVAFVTRSMAF